MRFDLSHLIEEVEKCILEFCGNCFVLVTTVEERMVNFNGLEQKLKL